MNDDAKFFFFLSGFTGSLVFFCVSLFLYEDVSKSLLLASLGCILFSIAGRRMLCFALSGCDSAKPVKFSNTEESSEDSTPSIPSGEDLAAVTNLEAVRNSKAIK